MRIFSIKLIKFISPLLILFLPVYLFFMLTGENYYSIDRIIKSEEKSLVGYAYNDDNYRYMKWRNICLNQRREVWALGSSRVLQFRQEMFERSFYNSGYTISSISDFLPFIEALPEDKYPELLIVALDQWMFNENWDDLSSINKSDYWEDSYSFSPSSNTILSVFDDLLVGKYDLSIVLRKEDGISRIGLNALVNEMGFRNDGSFYYGCQIAKLLTGDTLADDYEFSDTFDRIEKGNRRFEYGIESNPDAFIELDAFLKYCSSKDIYVVGFIPPFASRVRGKIDEMGRYQYMHTIYNRASPLFEEKGFEFWDLECARNYNSGDDEFIDGFHGGELTYTKMLTFLAKNKSEIRKYTSVKKLEVEMLDIKNRYIVYDY